MKNKYEIGDIVVYRKHYCDNEEYYVGKITKIELTVDNLYYTIKIMGGETEWMGTQVIDEEAIIFIVKDEKNIEKADKICVRYKLEKDKSLDEFYTQSNREIKKIELNMVEKLKQDLIKLERN